MQDRFITRDEAYYICGILNSDIIIEYMQNTFKSNGYSLQKSQFYLPLYDKQNALHKEICRLAKKASKLSDEQKIAGLQTEISNLYIELCENR